MFTAAQRTRLALGTGISLGILMLILVGYTVFRNANRFIQTADDVSRINRVLTMIKDLDLTLTRAESEYRGFLFTNDLKYISSFDTVSFEMDRQFKLISSVEEGQLETLANIREAKDIADQKIQDMRGTLILRQQVGLVAARTDYSEKQGMRLMRSFRLALNKIETRERAQLKKEDYANRYNRDEARQYLLFGLGFSIVAVLASMLIVVRDAERRMLAETRLQSALTLQTAIFDAANAAIFAFSPSGRITLFNLTAERWLGYRGDEVLGRMVPTAFHEPNELRECAELRGRPNDLIHAITEGARENEREERRWTLVRKDGSLFPAVVSYSVLRDADARPVGFVGVATDVTEIEEARRELNEHVSQLESARGTLADQNAALERAANELKESRDIAITATNLKSEFLANMSHEIRTPMNGILGMSHLLMQTSLNVRQRNFVRTVQRSAEGLLSVLNDILDLSKMEAGKVELETVAFDLRSLLEDACAAIAPAVHAKGIELTCEVPPEAQLWVAGDPSRLRQIVTNLLSNAAKFTSQGEINLTLSELAESDRLSRYRFSIRDTGIGILPDRQARIFESFAQADGSTTRRFGGTGLGLTISRQLAELMGGKIGVNSVFGMGSEFWIELPFEPLPSPNSPPLGAGPLDNRQILVIDDSATNRLILRQYLESWRANVIEAANASEAESFLKQRSVDAILLDRYLPDVDVASWSVVMESRAGMAPIIYLSPVSDLAQDENTFRMPRTLPKPVRYQDLFDELVRTLTGQTRVSPEEFEDNFEGFEGLRVLVVEDNTVNQLVATELLASWGCVPVAAENGAVALDILYSSAPFDLVLMDVQMPVLDGLKTTMAIRLEEGNTNRHLPIVAMTANAMSGDRERCLAVGMDDYLSKPLQPSQLRAILEAYSRKAQDLGPSRSKTTPVLDEDRLNESSGFKPTLRKKILERYVASSSVQLESIIATAKAIDLNALASAAHALKGSSLTIGAVQVAELCSTIETSARILQPGKVETTAVKELQSAMIELHEALSPYLQDPEAKS